MTAQTLGKITNRNDYNSAFTEHLIFARNGDEHIICLISLFSQLYEKSIILSQQRKLRHREVK